MPLFRGLVRGLRALFRRADAVHDVDDELRHYLEEAIAAGLARGLTPEAARLAARRELGSPAAARDQILGAGWERIIREFAADVGHAVRQVRRTAGFSVTVILTLGLGIGASTAIYSALDPILLRPLPYPAPARIVTLWDHGTDGRRLPVTFGTFREVAERSRSFDALAVMRTWQPTIGGQGDPERSDGQAVSSGFFRVLGIRPAMGRDFLPPEDLPHGPRAVILADSLWRRRLDADPAALGTTMTLDGATYTIVGILPRGFQNVLEPDAEVWTPLQYDPALPADGREWGHHLRLVGRLAAGATSDRARRETAAIATAPDPAFARPAWAAFEGGLDVAVLQDDVTRAVRPGLRAVAGAALLLLLITCVNVTNLLLARGATRRDEMAMRVALGASRARLVRQWLAESLFFAALGGAAGLGLAAAAVRAIVAIAPADLPRAQAIQLDARAAVFAVAVSAVVGLVVGVLPALHASRRAGIQAAGARVTRGQRGARRALVMAEMAVAVVLLVGAGLLLRSVRGLFAVPSGFDASHVLVMRVQASNPRAAAGAIDRVFAGTLDGVAHLPGAAAAAYTTQLPLSGDEDVYGVHAESSAADSREGGTGAYRYAVSAGYLEAMGVPLREGRFFTPRDTAGVPHAVVVSDSFARHTFPGREAIGQRVRIGSVDGPWFTVVGIVGDVKQTSLTSADADAVYITPEQWPYVEAARWLVMRAEGDPARLAAAVRRAVWSVDPHQPIVRQSSLDDIVAASVAGRRFALVLFELFGLTALLLAAAGAYGVLAGSVAERTREVGVRLALGATRARILALVAREGLLLAGAGILVGLVGAAVASRALTSLLFGVTRLDPSTYGAVGGMMLAVAAAAAAVPAWRAARIDPARTLRA